MKNYCNHLIRILFVVMFGYIQNVEAAAAPSDLECAKNLTAVMLGRVCLALDLVNNKGSKTDKQLLTEVRDLLCLEKAKTSFDAAADKYAALYKIKDTLSETEKGILGFNPADIAIATYVPAQKKAFKDCIPSFGLLK